MIDLILFIMITFLTVIFIFVVAPVLTKTINNKDVEKVEILVNRVVLFIEQTEKTISNEEKKHLAISYTKTILEYLDIEFNVLLLEILIEAQVYLLKNKKANY
ncbi:hypothetical protein CACET_c17830 [Clostridium aceticum]|uniref:Uncharacterized protein n=1 Tax=Clostridium aceticum TaxID=84022 RepID=A0A0D8ICQ4_9CLOT|nr:phage holin, LLH family [Clostridium aceticum]AKL95231.1 hypothetical protein CACET_c17830 [Clostridium aceticum]KJF28090.1 hypothetical protein TZ02_05945 [Clostridium aceticum]